jgi:hypothetical protein
MPKGGIGVCAALGKERNAIDDEIAGTNEPTTKSGQDREDKHCLWERCSGLTPTFALPGGARDAGTAILAQWQAARQSQGRPITQLVAHIPRRKPPQGAQECEKQKGLFVVSPRRTTLACRQWEGHR